MSYTNRRRVNWKVVALLIEIVLLVAVSVVMIVLNGINITFNIIPMVIVTMVIVFCLILTLSMIRYDYMRSNRSEFKETNLPLYTDQTTMLAHDMRDESEGRKSE